MGRFIKPVCSICGAIGKTFDDPDWKYQDLCPKHSNKKIMANLKQILSDELEQAIKRGGGAYATAYIEGYADGYGLNNKEIGRLILIIKTLHDLHLVTNKDREGLWMRFAKDNNLLNEEQELERSVATKES